MYILIGLVVNVCSVDASGYMIVVVVRRNPSSAIYINCEHLLGFIPFEETEHKWKTDKSEHLGHSRSRKVLHICVLCSYL